MIVRLTELLVVTGLFLSAAARAETVQCSGAAATYPPTKIEVSVDMDKGQSWLRWIYPDGLGITQGQTMNQRKYPGPNTVRYQSDSSGQVALEIPIASAPPLQGTFTHSAQGLNAVPVTCELFGKIPNAPICPKNKDAALLRAMDTAQSLDDVE